MLTQLAFKGEFALSLPDGKREIIPQIVKQQCPFREFSPAFFFYYIPQFNIYNGFTVFKIRHHNALTIPEDVYRISFFVYCCTLALLGDFSFLKRHSIDLHQLSGS
jgi:hypothetical protein